MKNFKLKESEELVRIIKNVEVEANENKYVLTVFLTTKRLVLLKDVNKELEFNAFLASRMVDIPEDLEVVFDLNLDEVKKVVYSKGQNIITFKENDNKLVLYCENITKLISRTLWSTQVIITAWKIKSLN